MLEKHACRIAAAGTMRKRSATLPQGESDEQRRHGAKATGPFGEGLFWAISSLLDRSHSHSYAPSSRLELTSNLALQIDSVIVCQAQSAKARRKKYARKAVAIKKSG
ncbi:MAG: hypothetical protein HY611_09565 [Elusimicrobia bacterium]|nr:hypothetical protein [Elusimicrobiota bacterium]